MPLPSAAGDRWLKFSELWDLTELSSAISRALTAIYMLKAGRNYGFKANFEKTLQNLESCAKVLRMFFEELEQYAEGLAPETEIVSMLEDAFGTTDSQKMLKQMTEALRGVEKLINALKSGTFGWEILDDRDVAELEELLEKLSRALSTRVERMAGELFGF